MKWKALKKSPVVSRELIKPILSICSVKDWSPRTMDVKTAFLQGSALKRELYIKPPNESKVHKNWVWKLLKPVYELRDASFRWYKQVRCKLENRGFVVCPYEPSLLCFKDKIRCLEGRIILHVDDFMYAGTASFERNVIFLLSPVFKFRT